MTNESLRHTLATLAYRGAKTLRGAPDTFASFRVAETSRTPAEILAHIGDLFDWALALADGHHTWHDATPLAWPDESARFFAALEALDKRLASGPLVRFTPEQLFQGPVADALWHVGQIAMLRRLAGSPIKGENYLMAHIQAGRVTADQPPAVREF